MDAYELSKLKIDDVIHNKRTKKEWLVIDREEWYVIAVTDKKCNSISYEELMKFYNKGSVCDAN